MRALIFDSTPLIYLAKTKVLKLIERLPEQKFVSRTVYDEVVVGGREKGATDAILIERLIDEGAIRLREVEDEKLLDVLLSNPRLHRADGETLALAAELAGVAIVDEDEARTTAGVYGIRNRGSIYIVFRLLKVGALTREEVKETVDGMIKAGWRCSTELYTEIVKHLIEHEKT